MNLIKKNFRLFMIIFAGLALLIIITSIISSSKEKKCKTLRDDILVIADKYIESKSLTPNNSGESVIINITDLDEEISFKNNKIEGTITYTNYEGKMIKTFEIKNASYCTTKKFAKETTKYFENKNTKVNVYFNYKNVTSYNSKWSNWLESSKISETETNGYYLPINTKDLPTIPNDAVVTEYVTETDTYYSYRDKKWKWYKNDIKYSDYSSTQPKGYTNKDTSTVTKTEYTKWSLNYPEEYDYRHIKSSTGYQWYYLDGKDKVYWENGNYTPDSPGTEYKKDTKKSAIVYSYSDDMWRWYNGDTKRIYSSSSSVKPNGYNYKDESTLTYTSWSKFSPDSNLTNENRIYREIKTDTYTRYLIKYDIYSYDVLDKPITREELEEKLGKSYEEIVNDSAIKLEITFKFQREA